MRFLGNKSRMLENIDLVIKENNISNGVFCDLFAGSGAVGDFFKDRFSIISNDYLYCLSIINRAKLNNSNIPAFDLFTKQFGMDPFSYFNKKDYVADSQYFITNNYSPKGNRQYFSEKNAIKIDGIRIEIEELYKDLVLDVNERDFLLASLLESIMGISNTTGTYEAFLKCWDKRALKDFELVPITIKNVDIYGSNIVYNLDSNEIIRKISGDVLYLDPPYTITDYCSAYHLLESVAKYDYPNISGKTGRREKSKDKSRYNRKELAYKNLEDIFRQAKFKHILLSYSTQGLIDIEEIVSLAKKFAKDKQVVIYQFPYREYKNIRSSKKGNNLKEVVIYFQKDLQIVRSPLNYTGSKYTIMNEIEKVLPKHISTFVDIMGGAFNVGVNITADKVVYNEYLPHTFEIIKLLLTTPKETIIQNIESIVNEYSLEKCNKETYIKLRSNYNNSKDVYKLFVLHMYCFQNQMRFNSKLEFNTPVGNCSYNETHTQRINCFVPRSDEIELLNKSYADINVEDYDKNAVFYFDPPYFITSATYNDGKRGFIGWSADEETKLLEYITDLHSKGYRFILSNVIYHNDTCNYLLAEWIKTHSFNIKYIDNVGSKNSRNEVLISNFDWRDT